MEIFNEKHNFFEVFVAWFQSNAVIAYFFRFSGWLNMEFLLESPAQTSVEAHLRLNKISNGIFALNSIDGL